MPFVAVRIHRGSCVLAYIAPCVYAYIAPCVWHSLPCVRPSTTHCVQKVGGWSDLPEIGFLKNMVDYLTPGFSNLTNRHV